MKILGIGTEIVECLRIRRMIDRHGELFLGRVFTEREMRACQAHKRATEYFAGHWSAKHAVAKALGVRMQKGLSWTEIEIQSDPLTPPKVAIRGATKDLAVRLGVAEIHVSIAHCRTYAIAFATVVGREE